MLHCARAPLELDDSRSTSEAAMSITARLLHFIVISLYPHTLVCKTGRTLKQIISGLLEFWGVHSAWLDWERDSYDCFFWGMFHAWR